MSTITDTTTTTTRAAPRTLPNGARNILRRRRGI